MVRISLVFIGLCLSGLQAQAQEAAPDFPSWAYAVNTNSPQPRPPGKGKVFKVPDSKTTAARKQLANPFSPPDWHPEDHPAMPKVVAQGRSSVVWACATCHRPNGAGGPEIASIAGLPAQYIMEQVQDFASGARSSAGPQRLPHSLKQMFAKQFTEDELREAADYYSSLTPRLAVVVKESSTAPKLVNHGMYFAPAKDGSEEELGARIVEVPEDPARYYLLHDDRVQFTAYVPPGSVARGLALTRAPGGNTKLVCAKCHGKDSRGVELIPSIAGLSPAYVVRQLWDLKTGARNGAAAEDMIKVAQVLSGEDMVALAAYLATLKP